ncbi:YcaO-like family protein [Serinicoccus sp. CUA-874]|uniref:YcaO-like family protein n=1 Tax=Serinicoccus sp. CUA-874 TaxID=1517939 RepID=UPI0022A9579D|nr:YcaO-like family protein [Serinicoccus sp. CUA-874]
MRTAGHQDVPYGVGAGKGAPQTACVGALYEAVEHALSGPESLVTADVAVHRASDIATPSWEGDRALELVRGTEGMLACLNYRTVDDHEPAALPIALWAPWYVAESRELTDARTGIGDDASYRLLRAYSCNTGCAIGASSAEATLHAINEWVERDALSLFQLVSIHDEGQLPPLIDRGLLPSDVVAMLEGAEAALGQRVHLLDLTTDVGIPVVMAYLADRRMIPGKGYGMGASLRAATAVERAVSEVVQGELLAAVVTEQVSAISPRVAGDAHTPGLRPTYEDVIQEHDTAERIRSRLAPYPRLLASAQLDMAPRVLDSVPRGCPIDIASPDATVPEQERLAAARVRAVGSRVFRATLAALPAGTTLVQVQCPGLERFHQITNGHLALPGERGRRARMRRSVR